MKVVGIITTVVVSVIVTLLWSGYVLSILWSWFVVATFGCPELAVPNAIGITCVVGYLTQPRPKEPKDTDKFLEQFGNAVAYALIKPAFALLFGWIVQFWV